MKPLRLYGKGPFIWTLRILFSREIIYDAGSEILTLKVISGWLVVEDSQADLNVTSVSVLSHQASARLAPSHNLVQGRCLLLTF